MAVTILLHLLAWFGGGVVLMAIIVPTVWALFKWLGEKWIDQKFEKSMEAYRTEQQRELERLRHKINAVFDRTTRLHEREFEHLPEVWGLLHEAVEKSAFYLQPFKSYPRVEGMDELELAKWLGRSEYSEGEKELIANAAHPQKALERIVEFRKYDVTVDSLNAFASAFRKKGIFIEPALKGKMHTYFSLMRSAVTKQHFSYEHELNAPIREDYKKYEVQGHKILEEIESEVQSRLWNSTVTEI